MIMIVRKCEECQKEFTCYPSNKKKFCSRACSGFAQSKRQVGENNPSWRGGPKSEEEIREYNKEYLRKNKDRMSKNSCIVCSKKCRGKYCSMACKGKAEKKEIILICEYCNKSYISIPSKKNKKYCSKSCYDKAQSKKVEIKCEVCGRIKVVPRCAITQKYCSSKCKGLAKIGHNNPNWKNGVFSLNHRIRDLSEYKEWRTSVFERDKYTCALCGKTGGWIEVHHIVPFSDIIKKKNIKSVTEAKLCKELWDISNGVTVCPCCHGDIDKDRFIRHC